MTVGWKKFEAGGAAVEGEMWVKGNWNSHFFLKYIFKQWPQTLHRSVQIRNFKGTFERFFFFKDWQRKRRGERGRDQRFGDQRNSLSTDRKEGRWGIGTNKERCRTYGLGVQTSARQVRKCESSAIRSHHLFSRGKVKSWAVRETPQVEPKALAAVIWIWWGGLPWAQPGHWIWQTGGEWDGRGSRQRLTAAETRFQVWQQQHDWLI